MRLTSIRLTILTWQSEHMSYNWYIKAEDKIGKHKTEIIMLYLERAGHATTAELAEACSCSPNTARKWLFRLAQDDKVYWKAHYYARGYYLLRWFLK